MREMPSGTALPDRYSALLSCCCLWGAQQCTLAPPKATSDDDRWLHSVGGRLRHQALSLPRGPPRDERGGRLFAEVLPLGRLRHEALSPRSFSWRDGCWGRPLAEVLLAGAGLASKNCVDISSRRPVVVLQTTGGVGGPWLLLKGRRTVVAVRVVRKGS